MNIFKVLLLCLIPLSASFPYSNTCGFPLIRTITENYIDNNSMLPRSSEIGSIETFNVRNLSTNELENDIQFELLAADGISNFWGEISELSNGNIDLTIIQELFQAFTLSTPAADSINLKDGIKIAEEDILGLPPNINGNLDVHILFMDIRDGYSNSGEFIAGFFDPQDQFICYDSRDCNSESLGYYPTSTENSCVANNLFWQSCGNGENIIYIDTYPLILNQAGLENTLFTLAHEYQHLLHWNADVKEGHFQTNNSEYAFHNPWLNEGISDLMPSILGLGLRDFTHYLENPAIGLDEWHNIGSSPTLPYYAKSALFFSIFI